MFRVRTYLLPDKERGFNTAFPGKWYGSCRVLRQLGGEVNLLQMENPSAKINGTQTRQFLFIGSDVTGSIQEEMTKQSLSHRLSEHDVVHETDDSNANTPGRPRGGMKRPPPGEDTPTRYNFRPRSK